MNIKIFNKIQDMYKVSPHLITDANAFDQAIKAVFDINVSSEGKSMHELVDEIDTLVLEYYFTKVWQPKHKKYKYSGLSIVDEINNLKPRSVLDLGCGFNEFKGKIHNLIGVDAFNQKADINANILDYNPTEKFDVVICFGSINFGSTYKIFKELAHAVSLTNMGGLLFFRVNPGLMHDAEEAKWIDFFAYDYTFILNTANTLNCDVVALREDANRIYFVLKTR